MGIESQFLTRAEFARARGWARSYITKLGQQGKLVLDAGGKLIDVRATSALLDRTVDPGKDAIRKHHAAARGDKQIELPQSDAPPSADPKYWDNKTRREGALAEMAELDLAKKRDELVERASVEVMSFASGRMTRDMMLGLPTRLAPAIAAMTDAFEIEVLLRDAIRQVFLDAMKMTASDLLRATDQSH
jgi:hypothetical protein